MTEDENKNKRTDLPYLIDRIKAMMIDGILIVLLMIFATLLFEAINYEGGNGKIAIYILIFMYEPLMVSMGGTFGHKLMKLRVKSISDESKNIIFPLAVIRFLTKGLLGWISLITVSTNSRKRAIHDMASGSIMITNLR